MRDLAVAPDELQTDPHLDRGLHRAKSLGEPIECAQPAQGARTRSQIRVGPEQAAREPMAAYGAAGGADFPWMRETAQALADALPDGANTHPGGSGGNVDPAILAPALVEFFT